MKRITTLIAATALVGGCATEGNFVAQNTDNDCDGKGRSESTIRYGDSYIEVTPRVKTKRKGEIIFILKPEKKSEFGIDYEALEITIEGKTADDQWLNKKEKASDGKKIFVCVDPNQPLGEYEYKVIVPKVGVIDPRVNVN